MTTSEKITEQCTSIEVTDDLGLRVRGPAGEFELQLTGQGAMRMAQALIGAVLEYRERVEKQQAARTKHDLAQQLIEGN